MGAPDDPGHHHTLRVDRGRIKKKPQVVTECTWTELSRTADSQPHALDGVSREDQEDRSIFLFLMRSAREFAQKL